MEETSSFERFAMNNNTWHSGETGHSWVGQGLTPSPSRWLQSYLRMDQLLGPDLAITPNAVRSAKTLDTKFTNPLPHIQVITSGHHFHPTFQPPPEKGPDTMCCVVFPVALLGAIASLPGGLILVVTICVLFSKPFPPESSHTKLTILLCLAMGHHGIGAEQVSAPTHTDTNIIQFGMASPQHPNQAPTPLYEWFPNSPFIKRYTALADMSVTWFQSQALWGAQSTVQALTDLFQYRIVLDAAPLARVKHNTRFFLENLRPVHQYLRQDRFILPYLAAPYEVLVQPDMTYEDCQQLGHSTNSTIPNNLPMMDFLHTFVDSQPTMSMTKTYWLESSLIIGKGDPPAVSIKFDGINIYPPDKLASDGRIEGISCPVVVSRHGKGVILPLGELPSGYTWWDGRQSTYHEYHVFKFRLASSPNWQQCSVFTPLRNGEVEPEAYKNECVLFRNPVQSQLAAYWLDRNKEDLLHSLDSLPLEVEDYRIDLAESQPPLSVSQLETVPSVHHGDHILVQPPPPPSASPSNQSSPLKARGAGFGTTTGYLPAAAVRPILGSNEVAEEAPEVGRGDPVAAALVAHPVITSLASSAGGYILRGLATDAARQYARLATEQAQYRVVDPWLLDRVTHSGDSPQSLLNKITEPMNANFSLIQHNNVILMESLVKAQLLDASAVLYDAHFKAGLQMAASNIQILQEALKHLDEVAVESGLAALSAHGLALRSSGPALVKIVKSDSYYLLHFFMATTSPKTDTTFRFFPLPSYSSTSADTALFLNLPKTHKLSPYPSKDNVSLVQSTCADTVLGSSFDVNGVLEEEFCQYQERSLTLVSVLHSTQHGQLLLVSKTSAPSVSFFLACLETTARRFNSVKAFNVIFLPVHCSIRISANSKLVNIPARAPHHRYHEQTFLWLYSWDVSFRPFSLTKSQRFEALLLTFLLTSLSTGFIVIYFIVKFWPQIKLVWQARHRALPAHPPTPSPSPSTMPPPMSVMELAYTPTVSRPPLPRHAPVVTGGATPPPEYREHRSGSEYYRVPALSPPLFTSARLAQATRTTAQSPTQSIDTEAWHAELLALNELHLQARRQPVPSRPTPPPASKPADYLAPSTKA